MIFIRKLFRRDSFRIKNRVTVITDINGFPISRIEGTVVPDEVLALLHMNYIEYTLCARPYIYYSIYATIFERPVIGTISNMEDYDDITIDIILFGDIYNISDRQFVEQLMGPNGDFYGYSCDSRDFERLIGWIYNDVRGLNVTQIKFMRDQEVSRIINVETNNVLISH